jgi:D-alanyl-lipoteichoic acid acyltransferase DltB (MBOAT superfamily)
MLFNSIDFVIFLFVVFVLYWFVTNKNLKLQNLLLLFSSYVFYGWWDWRFLSLILISSIVDYTSGIKISEAKTFRIKKTWLLISVFTNLGILGFFKYYNFFSDSFAIAMESLGWEVGSLTLNIILPVGISFYTFQTMSYSIDIYRGTLKPSRNIVAFFTYVAFFPQLVAGPIERASNLLPQIEKIRSFKEKWFNEGIIQIAVGLFRKVVIADNLAVYVDLIYENPEIYNSSTLLLATILYSFQIYYDFSGYSDIAIGTAKLFGFKFQQNFNLPYFSKSITEFWRRWHISLSSWLKDYLYISLGGNRKGIKITYRNLIITMLLGGLWHGSSWNFLVWGGIHGVVLSIEKLIFSRAKIKNFKVWGMIYTYIIVILAWVFFRAPNLDQSLYIISKLIFFDFSMPYLTGVNSLINAIPMLFLGLVIDLFIFRKKISLEEIGGKLTFGKRVSVLSIIIIIICLFYSTSNNFIYFQF